MRDRTLWTYVAASVLLCVPAIIGVCRMDHLALHVAINRHHAPWADQVFAVGTQLANGWTPTLLAFFLLWRSWRAFLLMGLSAGVSAIAVQMLKHWVFLAMQRPYMFLDRMPGLHLVPGIELHHGLSFPSGHATSAFSMCLALAVLADRRWSAVLFALVAALLAFSRVYLSQHFTEDVLAGALLGTSTGIGAYFLLYKGAWGRSPRLDRSPFRRQNQ
jgi:membrane-associated phospholipid phosphatase